MDDSAIQDSGSCRAKLQSLPPDLCSLADYETKSREYIDFPTLEYISGGSGSEQSVKANNHAFEHIQLQSRLLSDCSKGTTITQVGKFSLSHPIMLAPVAYQSLVHPEGELHTAQAADALESCLVLSTWSSCTLEAVAEKGPRNRWFQLYFQPDRNNTLDLVKRAERAGYQAIMVTLDTPVQMISHRARKAKFSLPPSVKAVNLEGYSKPGNIELRPDQSRIFQGAMSEAPTWPDIDWLVSNTVLPVYVKGVLNEQDALAFANRGLAGIVVSNHGGRALDCVPPAIEVLADIRRTVGPHFPLIVDGGIRCGTDVFKAIALGANAVMIGRPLIWGLAVAGALGVAHIVKILREELEVCMALTGCSRISDIDAEKIRISNR